MSRSKTLNNNSKIQDNSSKLIRKTPQTILLNLNKKTKLRQPNNLIYRLLNKILLKKKSLLMKSNKTDWLKIQMPSLLRLNQKEKKRKKRKLKINQKLNSNIQTRIIQFLRFSLETFPSTLLKKLSLSFSKHVAIWSMSSSWEVKHSSSSLPKSPKKKL